MVTQREHGGYICTRKKTDFNSKSVKRDKEIHYNMVKGIIHQHDIIIININVFQQQNT